MKPVALESGALISAAYDATRELLQLEFRDGAVYQYFDVAAAIYESLLQKPLLQSSHPRPLCVHGLHNGILILALMGPPGSARDARVPLVLASGPEAKIKVWASAVC